MATFTVHVPPGIGDPAVRADRTAFVRDGFSWRAFLLGPVDLLYHRLWRETLVWLVGAGLLALLLRSLDLSASAGFALYLALAVLTGLESGQARCRALDRRGYVATAVVAGMTRLEAERRFFAEQAGLNRATPAGPAATGRSAVRGTSVIGLFPEPGGRR